MRITDKESRMIGATLIAVGDIHLNTLMMFEGMTKERAKEICDIFPTLTKEEVDLIRSHLPDKE